jgi:hypothetical protein
VFTLLVVAGLEPRFAPGEWSDRLLALLVVELEVVLALLALLARCCLDGADVSVTDPLSVLVSMLRPGGYGEMHVNYLRGRADVALRAA